MILKNRIAEYLAQSPFKNRVEFINALAAEGIVRHRVMVSRWVNNHSQPLDEARPIIAKLLKKPVDKVFYYE